MSNQPLASSLVRALTAAAAESDAVAGQLFDRFTHPTRQSIVARLARGQTDRQIRADADLLAVADALIGSFLVRVINRASGPIEPLLSIVTSLLAGVGVREH